MRSTLPRLAVTMAAFALLLLAVPAQGQTISDSQITWRGDLFWTNTAESDPAGRLRTTYEGGTGLLAFPGAQVARAEYGLYGVPWNVFPLAGRVWEYQLTEQGAASSFGVWTDCPNLHSSAPCFIGGWIEVAGSSPLRLRPVAVFNDKIPVPEVAAAPGDRFGVEWRPDAAQGDAFRYYKRGGGDGHWTLVAEGPREPNALPFGGQTFTLAASFAPDTGIRQIGRTAEFTFNP